MEPAVPAAVAQHAPPVAMVTCFLNTPDMLLPWIEHYAALGVGFFYLYYNADVGVASAPLATPAMQAVLARPDVLLIEWTPPFFDAWGIRLSQAPAMQSAWNRFRGYHAHLLFFDMDEYLLLPPGETVPSFLASQNASCVVHQFPSAFAWLDCADGDGAAEAEAPRRLAGLRSRCTARRAADWFTTKRQKMALRTDSQVGVINIHQAFSDAPATELTCAVPPSVAHFVHILNLSPSGASVPHGSVNDTEIEIVRRTANVPVPGWASGTNLHPEPF